MLKITSLKSFTEGQQSYFKIPKKNYHQEDLTEALQIPLGKCRTTVNKP